MYKAVKNADITELTTFGTRAECGCLVTYGSVEDLRLLSAEQPDLLSGDVFCLGGGSNVVFVSDRIKTTVLHCVGSDIMEVPSGEDDEYTVRLKVQAGVVLDKLVDYAVDHGLWGLENLAGIPGCIGGAAVQNVGAYGAEFSDCVKTVRAFNLDTFEPVELSADECEYAYRHSYFKTAQAQRLAIFEVEITLTKRAVPKLEYAGVKEALGDCDFESVTPRQIARAIRYVRATKLPDPRIVGSAGSYFKNPIIPASLLPEIESAWSRYCVENGVEQLPLQYHRSPDGNIKLSAAWLIDKAGCKAFFKGGAALWPSQPLVLVNRTAEASGRDVMALQHEIQNRVRAVFGVMLQPEVVQIGDR